MGGMSGDTIEVAELFAGVGGFRLGLEGQPDSGEDTGFKVVWSNQWEPGEKAQWASTIYEMQFGSENHNGDSIHKITFPEEEGVGTIEAINRDIPDHDLLVGGFPCQDYSVARTISGELGIKGEKGKLWVDIARIIRWKRPRPKVVLLENVPRLLNSPANARGLNFAIILNFLLNEGYHVEWRVINAADYGMPQQRSRVFILAYRTSGNGQNVRTNGNDHFGCKGRITRRKISTWMLGEKGEPAWKRGPFTEAFPGNGDLPDEAQEVPALDHTFNSKSSPFGNSGFAWKFHPSKMVDGKRRNRVYMMWTTKVKADYDGEKMLLKHVLDDELDPDYEVDASRIDEWRYAKGSKNEFRLRKRDRGNVDQDLLDLYDECMKEPFDQRAAMWKKHRGKFLDAVGEDAFYQYDEGKMKFDSPERASRTIVTDEIGRTPSRMRHIIEYEEGKYRRLTPEETERLNGFPAGWTDIPDIKPSRRGFLMGNALVVGVIERLRKPLLGILEREDD